ncbi:MAG: signal peptidase I [Thermoplasmata archaeon]|nr:signal peptidase I [Thermoplasmata archaeon]
MVANQIIRKKLMEGLFIIIVLFFILSFILIPLADRSSHWYIVTSGSMEPTLRVGDIVYVKSIEIDKIKIGDIITFYHEEHIITHRCVDILHNNGTFFKTKGDANEENDTFLTPTKDVIGKIPSFTLFGHTFYIKIPRIGYLSYFVHTRIGFILLIIFPGYLLIGLEAYNIFNVIQGRVYKIDGYTLYRYKKGIYYFAKNSKKGKPVPLPIGYEVVKEKGLLYIRKKDLGIIKCPYCDGIFYCEGIKIGDKIECVYCGKRWRIRC